MKYKSLGMWRIKLYIKINWIKTIIFNLKCFRLREAFQLPVIIFGQCRLSSLKGKIIVNGPIKTGMITVGHRFEVFTKSASCAELVIDGTWIINGKVQLGYDCKIYIGNNAVFETGHMCTIANSTKIVCANKIVMGNHVKIGDESQLLDTNFHDLYDVNLQQNIAKQGEIYLNSYIATGSRVTIMKNAKIPDYSLITSNSLCNKDFLSFGENNIFGGIPAKFIKNGIRRHWEAEEKQLEAYLTIKL